MQFVQRRKVRKGVEAVAFLIKESDFVVDISHPLDYCPRFLSWSFSPATRSRLVRDKSIFTCTACLPVYRSRIVRDLRGRRLQKGHYEGSRKYILVPPLAWNSALGSSQSYHQGSCNILHEVLDCMSLTIHSNPVKCTQ